MNAGWRDGTDWPPKAATTSYFLATDGGLTGTAPPTGAERRRADFSAYSAWPPWLPIAPVAEVDSLLGRPVPPIGAFGRNRQFMIGDPGGPPIRNSLETTSFVYTSRPLDRDTDVIGHPIIRVWASSTADDGDFFFYLEDVAPDGSAVLVTEYQHRAGFATLRSPDDLIPDNRGVRVEPRLPWHGYRKADYNPRIFADRKPPEIVTALFPTAWRFKAGHSIRVAVAAADWPTFELHPALSPSNRPGAVDNVVPEVTLHFGGRYRSRIELPVVRGRP